MIIGITGGIGSGKSTIARALAARGYAVYDCDKEAKRIIAENKDVRQQIIANCQMLCQTHNRAKGNK